ncbi:hypothetical protein [Arsenicicoccus sp. oral taxon 190]|uniref:hypothetical protein n=1 Tax=Arsenicicoccus sp. oral taxon 190 TaxID=1658671 RepID=UPI000679F466|nr:hypothetical protein [Arsenicicoccus sp. oral taxon 190]AKT52047.1 hypothetical protein ADJ73_13565 [Arsenicicoccus sp. oral taxon 190]
MVGEREPSTDVAQEAQRLKEALRDAWGTGGTPRAASEHAEPAERESLENVDPAPHAEYANHEHHDNGRSGPQTCVVCRASRFAHAAAPDLLEELGRGVTAVGRVMQDLAGVVRRHTDEHARADGPTTHPDPATEETS